MSIFGRRSSTDSKSRLEKRISELALSWTLSTSSRPTTGSRSGSALEDGFKGDLGLNVLHTVPEPLVDFIFVHGLGGGSRKTWAKSPDPGHFWPKAWLPYDSCFSRVRIHSFGYDTDWDEKKREQLDIHDFARSLLLEIDCSPDISRSKSKIIIVAHSMGGIIAKKSFLVAREDPSMRHLADRIHTFYFLATPHRGSDFAKTLRNILKITYGRKNYVDELLRDSRSIWSVNDSFRHYANDLHLWSFYETLNSNFVVKKAIVVDRNSATLGYPNENHGPLEADHRSICKFDDQSDPNYKILRNCFVKSIEAIEVAVSEELAITQSNERCGLAKMLAVTTPPVDDLATLTNIRLDGSCKWITSMQTYVSWKDPMESSYRIFLLIGNAAMGKSVLSSQVITDLCQNNLRCSYFFFKHDDSLRPSISACLRSLAYQMGFLDEDILKRLLDSEQHDLSWDEMDEGILWRKLFWGKIFRQTNLSLHYWVIDALDECCKPLAFLTLLRKLPPNLRIFITSRQIVEIEKFWPTLDPLPYLHIIKEEDTLQDLESFIDEKMVLSDEIDWMKLKLKKQILQKASGSFLWVALIIQELEQAYSDGIIKEILNEVPPDMNKLYERILSRMPRGQRLAKLAKAILTWTVLTLRPLTVAETQHFVNLDLHDTIFSLDKSFTAICGQLIRVDKSNKIKVMHQTTKTFLLQQKSYPEYAVEVINGHTRLAEICLEFLTGSGFRDARSQRTKNSPMKVDARCIIANYACIYFSDHLRRGSSEGSIGWSLLCKFFDDAVLSWIEHLASMGKIRHIARSAYNIRSYLSHRIEHLSLLTDQRATVEAWIIDLIRISVKFRQSISTLPSSIFTLIPAMCPSGSMIRKCFGDRFRGIVVSGHTVENWDDCLVHIDYSEHQPTAIVYGNQMLAVALSNGNITLYYWDSIQVKFRMAHEERVSFLTASECGRWLASVGLRKVRVWDVGTGSLVRTFATKDPALTVLFSHDGSVLTVATRDNRIIAWNLMDGSEQYQWEWIDSLRRDSDWIAPRQPPNRALFSPDYSALVVSYRGFHTYLFNIETESFIGCYVREEISPANCRRVSYGVDALAFNPNPEINVLVVSYGDGEIVVYDLWSTKIRFRIEDVFAHYLACSSDGRYLVATKSQGVMQIFTFEGIDGENLSLVYRIESYEGDIQDVTVSKDGFRIANILENRCSIWEPPLLNSGSPEEGSQSDINQSIKADFSTSAKLKQTLNSEITAVCLHPDGHMLFCGRRDGTVACVDTESTMSHNELYSHGANVTVISISYSQRFSLLVSADESSQINVYKVKVLGSQCEIVEMRNSVCLRQETRQSLESLLMREDCERFLTQRRTFAQVWTTQATPVGRALQFGNSADEPREKSLTIINHPFRTSYFLLIKHEKICVYSWLDGLEVQNVETETKDPSSVIISPNVEPQLIEKSVNLNLSNNQKRAEDCCIVSLFRVEDPASQSKRKFSVLKAWRVSQTSATEFSPLILSSIILGELASNIVQIIAVTGEVVLFLDIGFWVCSFDLAKIAEDRSCTFIRHFFLLPEWRFSNGQFLIEYVPAKREFIIAKQSEILVVKRGLDYSQSWVPIDPFIADDITRRDTTDSIGFETLD